MVGWIALGLLAVTILAFIVSPWPGALVIRAVFDKGAADKAAALEKHSPGGINRIVDESYRAGDRDAVLDIYYPDGTTAPLPTIVWAHGGAWISGSKNDTVPYFELLAAAGFTVVGVTPAGRRISTPPRSSSTTTLSPTSSTTRKGSISMRTGSCSPATPRAHSCPASLR